MAVRPGAPGIQRMEGCTAEQPLDLTGDPGTLGALVSGLVKADRVAGGDWPLAARRVRLGRSWRAASGPQHPARNQRGRLDRLQRPGDDGPAGPVVPRELPRGRAWIVLSEAQEQGHVGAAEAVDRLVRVAYDGQPATLARQQPQQPVLGGVDVLIL